MSSSDPIFQVREAGLGPASSWPEASVDQAPSSLMTSHSPEILRAALEGVANALNIPGGVETVLQVFTPKELRGRLDGSESSYNARQLALQFVEGVTARACTLALVDQAIEDSVAPVPVPVEAFMEEFVNRASLKRIVVDLKGSSCKGMKVSMLPAVAGDWWDKRGTLLEAVDFEEREMAPAAVWDAQSSESIDLTSWRPPTPLGKKACTTAPRKKGAAPKAPRRAKKVAEPSAPPRAKK